MTPRRLVASFASLALVATVMRCNPVYDVTISLSDAAAARGFGCSDDAGLIVTRLEGKPVTIVFDVLDLGPNVLSCRTTSIADYCAQAGCPRIARVCYTIDLSGSTSFAQALQNTYEQLKADDAGVRNIPTDRTVLVRFVATAEQGCPSGQLDGKLVGGCVYSCPARLNESGSIALDLDAPTFVSCDVAVAACATFPASP